MKFQQPGDARKSALGKKRERAAIDRVTQHLAGIRSAPVSIESLYEVRAEPAQQQPCQRHTIHFSLDHKRKSRRQDRRENDPIQVTGVIRNDD
jgi:hypothetical protein